VLERRYYELVNKRDLTACFELCAADLVTHSSLGETHGLEECKKSLREELGAFPDLHFTVRDIIAEGDKVVTRCPVNGTHKGEIKASALHTRKRRCGKPRPTALQKANSRKSGQGTMPWA